MNGVNGLWRNVFGLAKTKPAFEYGPVARSIEEADLIRPCVADFSAEGPRSVYHDWLLANGDSAKAKVLSACLKAYADGSLKHLRRLPAETSWSRLLGVPLLRLLTKETGGGPEFDRLKTLILPLLKPALAIEYAPLSETPPIGSSHFWGQPDLEQAAKWPYLAECSAVFDDFDKLPQDIPCGFLGQIAWRDLKATIFGQDLPDAGGMSIFTFTEVHELGVMETVIRNWDPKSVLTRHATPDQLLKDDYGDGANGRFDPHALLYKEVLSLPDATDGPFEKLLREFKMGQANHPLYTALKEACGDNRFGLGGYLSATSGRDPTPDVDWIRLLVMRTNPDCGVVHFAVRETDLAKGDLSNARYVWMDWDS